jgi:hypothetical protein
MINYIQFMRRGKTYAGSWEEKSPKVMRLLTKPRRLKHGVKTRFWKSCYLVQPSIILQDQAITAKTSTSEVVSKDPTWQDG